MLTADRFYATARLVGWCQGAGWNYRLRLKSNLILQHAGAEIVTGEIVTGEIVTGEIVTGEIAHFAPKGIINAQMNGSPNRLGYAIMA